MISVAAPGPSKVTTSSASRIGGKHSDRLHRPHRQDLDDAAEIAAEQPERDADDAGEHGGRRRRPISEARAPQMMRESTSRPYSSWPSRCASDGGASRARHFHRHRIGERQQRRRKRDER